MKQTLHTHEFIVVVVVMAFVFCFSVSIFLYRLTYFFYDAENGRKAVPIRYFMINIELTV